MTKKAPRFSKTEIKAAVAVGTEAGADIVIDYPKGQIRILRSLTGGGAITEILEGDALDDEASRAEERMKTAFGGRK